MRRTIWIILAIVAVFAVVLVARLPASWVMGALPPGFECRTPAGTLWRGACGELMAQSASLGALNWQLHPAALIRGSIDAHIDLAGGSASAAADVVARSSGSVLVRNLKGVVPLESGLIPQLPNGIRGTTSLDLQVLQLSGRAVERIAGRIEIRGLSQGRGGYGLGDYAVEFPAAAAAGSEPVGHVRDLGGPLAVNGTLRLTREPGYVLEGAAAARPGADPRLTEELGYLGRPDAAGRRSFSLAGTY